MKSATTKKVARKGQQPVIPATKKRRYYQSRKKCTVGKRTTDFSLHPKRCNPHFDVEVFQRNRHQLSKKRKPVFAKSGFILNFTVTVNISNSCKKRKKNTDKIAEDKIKNTTKDHTEESSVDNDNDKTITDVDDDFDNVHSFGSECSDDDNSTVCDDKDATDDDAEVNQEKFPRKSTHHASKKSPRKGNQQALKKSKITKTLKKHASKKLCKQPTKSRKSHHVKWGTSKDFL